MAIQSMQTPSIRPPKAKEMKVFDGSAWSETGGDSSGMGGPAPQAGGVESQPMRGRSPVAAPKEWETRQSGQRMRPQVSPLSGGRGGVLPMDLMALRRIDPREPDKEVDAWGGKERPKWVWERETAPEVDKPPDFRRIDPREPDKEVDAWGGKERPKWVWERETAPEVDKPGYERTDQTNPYPLTDRPHGLPEYIRSGVDPFDSSPPTRVPGYRYTGGPDPSRGTERYAPGPGGAPSGPDPYARGEGGMSGELERFAREGLETPSRYDLDLIRQGTALVDRELQQQGQGARRDLDEFLSSRGLTGSNIEAEEHRRLAEGLEDQRAQRLFDLQREQAITAAQDRATAGQLAGQTQQLHQQESQFGRSLHEQQAGRQQQESQFARDHGLDTAQFSESQRQFNVGMSERQSERQQQESQFARQHGLDVDQFRESQRQFSTQMAEQIAGRMQQENQFARGLNLDHTKLSVQSALETRAMNLQEKGMEMEDAFKRAELEVSSQLRTRALDLQKQGLEMEDAYRYAALEQDGQFRDRALNLEQQGLSMEDAYRGAELGYRQWASEQQLEQDRWRSQESSRLAELDILTRGLGMGLDVDLPQTGPQAPPVTPPGGNPPDPPVTPPGGNPPWHPPMVLPPGGAGGGGDDDHLRRFYVE